MPRRRWRLVFEHAAGRVNLAAVGREQRRIVLAVGVADRIVARRVHLAVPLAPIKRPIGVFQRPERHQTGLDVDAVKGAAAPRDVGGLEVKGRRRVRVRSGGGYGDEVRRRQARAVDESLCIHPLPEEIVGVDVGGDRIPFEARGSVGERGRSDDLRGLQPCDFAGNGAVVLHRRSRRQVQKLLRRLPVPEPLAGQR